MNGGVGNDTITSLGGKWNSLNGGADDDTITSHAGKGNTLDGGAGNDTITSHGDGATIDGGAGDDTITSHGDGATIDGGEGYDTFEVHGNNAQIYGSSDEVASFAHIKGMMGVSINLGSETEDGVKAEIFSFGNPSIFQWFYGFDNVTGTSGSDNIQGNDLDNIIDGNGGADTLSGGGGDDHIIVETLNLIDGGEGIDRLTVTGGADIQVWASNVSNIEILEVIGDYSLQFTAARVRSMTDSNNTLTVEGDSEDYVLLVDRSIESMVSDKEGYDLYGTEKYNIYIDEDVSVSIIGAVIETAVDVALIA